MSIEWPFARPTDEIDPALADLNRQNKFLWTFLRSELGDIKRVGLETHEQAKLTNGRVNALEITSAQHTEQIVTLQRHGPRAEDVVREADARKWRVLAALGKAVVSKPVLAVAIPAAAGWLGWADYVKPLIESLAKGG